MKFIILSIVLTIALMLTVGCINPSSDCMVGSLSNVTVESSNVNESFSTSAGEDYIINGDLVYINDSKVFLSASPHTMKSGGYVYFNLTSKLYDGDIDVFFGFNVSNTKPKSAELFNPHNVSWNTSDSRFYFNVSSIKNSTSACLVGNAYNQIKHNITYQFIGGFINATNTTIYNTTSTIVCFDSYAKDGNNYTVTWHTEHTKLVEYTDITSKFYSINYAHGGMNKWYYLKNVPVTAGKNYLVRVWLDVAWNSEYNKYWFAVKPSTETFSQAIANNHFYALDPWFGGANYTYRRYFNCSDMIDGVPFVVNGSGGFDLGDCGQQQYVWTYCSGSATALYYNNCTDYVVANDTSQLPFEVETGNRTSYLSTNVWNLSVIMVQHMNDNSTASINDSTSNANHGTKKGANEPIEATGKISKAQSFDGTNDYVDVGQPDNLNFERTDNFSIVVWFKSDVSSSWQGLLGNAEYGGNWRGWGINEYIATGKLYPGLCSVGVTSSIAIIGNTVIFGSGVWHNIAVVYNGSSDADQVRMYIDGKTEGFTVGADTLTTTTKIANNFTIGDHGGYRFFDGSIDEVRIYNRQLSATEINQTYQNVIGTAGFGNLLSEESGCTPSWLNTSWSLDSSECLINNSLEQNYSLIQYDNNSCPESVNTTYYMTNYSTCVYAPTVENITWMTIGGYSSTELIYLQEMNYINADVANGSFVNITVENSGKVVDNQNMTYVSGNSYIYDTNFILSTTGNWTITVSSNSSYGHWTSLSTNFNVTKAVPIIATGFYGYDYRRKINSTDVDNLVVYTFDNIGLRWNFSDFDSEWNNTKNMMNYSNAILTARSFITFIFDGDYDPAVSYTNDTCAKITTNLSDLLLYPYVEEVSFIVMELNQSEENLTYFTNTIAECIVYATENKFPVYVKDYDTGLDEDWVSNFTVPYHTSTDNASFVNLEMATMRTNEDTNRVYYSLATEQINKAEDYHQSIMIKLRSLVHITNITYDYVAELDNNDVIIYNNDSVAKNITVNVSSVGIAGKDVWSSNTKKLIEKDTDGNFTIELPTFGYSEVYFEDLDHFSLLSLYKEKVYLNEVVSYNSTGGNDARSLSGNVDMKFELHSPYFAHGNQFFIDYTMVNESYITNSSPYSINIIAPGSVSPQPSEAINTTYSNLSLVYGYISVGDYSNSDEWETNKTTEADTWINNYSLGGIFIDGLDIGSPGVNFSTRFRNVVNYIQIQKQKSVITNDYTTYSQVGVGGIGDIDVKESFCARWDVNVSNPTYSWENWTVDYNRAVWIRTKNKPQLALSFGDVSDYSKMNYCYAMYLVMYGTSTGSNKNYFSYNQPTFVTQRQIFTIDPGDMLGNSWIEVNSTHFTRKYQNGIFHIYTDTHTWAFDNERTINKIDYCIFAQIPNVDFSDLSSLSFTVNNGSSYTINPSAFGNPGTWDGRTVCTDITNDSSIDGMYIIRMYPTNRSNTYGLSVWIQNNNATGAFSYINVSSGVYPTSEPGWSIWQKNASNFSSLYTWNYLGHLQMNHSFAGSVDFVTITQTEATENVSGIYSKNITISSSISYNLTVWSDIVEFNQSFNHAKYWNGSWVTLNNSASDSSCLTDEPVYNYSIIDGESHGVCYYYNGTSYLKFSAPHLSDQLYGIDGDCVPVWLNTSWSVWSNLTCEGDNMNQSRNLTQYDNNSCVGSSNTTYFEYQLVGPDLVNTSWSDCFENNTRYLVEYDTFECKSNVTYWEDCVNCNCSTCDDCELDLEGNCTTVLLTANITNQVGTCIDNPTNFSNKIFDCQGFTVRNNDSSNILNFHFNNDSSYGESNSLVYDFSGNGNNGTINGSVYASGKYGNALSFDGVDDYVDAGNSPSLDFTTENFTITAWIYISAYDSTTHVILKRGFWMVSGYILDISADTLEFITSQSGAAQYIVVGAINMPTAGQWIHIAAIRNGAVGKIYINGVDKTTYSDSIISPATSGDNVFIGTYDGILQYFNGSIDEVRIYNRALTAAEVLDIFNEKKGIHLNTKQNNTIQNCVVTGFDNGIFLNASLNISLINDTLKENNDNGIKLLNTNNSIIQNCNSSKNWMHDLFLNLSFNNNISNSTFNNAFLYGVYFDASSGNRLTNSTLNSNTNSGVYSVSSNTTITNNMACSNLVYDLYSLNWLSSIGDNNTANVTDSWRDNGFYGSRFNCLGVEDVLCECSTCAECNFYLNSGSCTTVLLTANITNQVGTCVTFPENASNKILDCQGYTLTGDETGYGVNLTLVVASNITVQNCVIINYSVGIYADPPCYQETANESTVCGGLDNGSYLCTGTWDGTDVCVNVYDGNWSSHGNAKSGEETYLYINYSKPASATSAVWQIKDNSGTSNVSIPESCFNDIVQLYAYSDYLGGSDTVEWRCYNGTWDMISLDIGTIELYEEGVYWNISCVNNITNTSWVNYANSSCYVNDTIDLNWSLIEYDANDCGNVSNVTYYMTNSTSCDYCTPNLVNTSWVDMSECFINNTKEQNLTEYDSNYCGEVANVTYYQWVSCGYKSVTNLTLINNNISSCSKGIYIKDLPNASVVNNHVENNSYGFYIENSNYTNLTNNYVCGNTGWDVWSQYDNFGTNNTFFLSYRVRDTGYYLGTYVCDIYNKNYWWFENIPKIWQHYYRNRLN